MSEPSDTRPTPERNRIPMREAHGDITRDMVFRLVHTFYARVREEPVLGPIFEAKLAGKWDEHLAKLVEFWATMALRTDSYKGRPLPPHVPLGLAPEHFERWLALFKQTARDTCSAQGAAFFIDRAERIADSFQMALGIGVKAWRPPG